MRGTAQAWLVLALAPACETTLVVRDDAPAASETDDGGSGTASTTTVGATATSVATTMGETTGGTTLESTSDSTGADDTMECGGGRTLCGDSCRDLTEDHGHCGRCFDDCDNTERCVDSECVCRPGLTDCDGDCVDTQSDPNNCGECGMLCAPNPCGAGDCLPGGRCGGLGTQCGLSCVDLETNLLHCGECNHPCEPGKECQGGDCEDPED